jgi:hypothetical protein
MLFLSEVYFYIYIIKVKLCVIMCNGRSKELREL